MFMEISCGGWEEHGSYYIEPDELEPTEKHTDIEKKKVPVTKIVKAKKVQKKKY